MSGLKENLQRWWQSRKRLRVEQHRTANIGLNSTVDRTVQVLGWANVRIGRHSVISEHTWLNVNRREQDTPRIVIGDFCFIGRRNFLSAADHIRIGDYCLTGVDCHFLGADHIHTTPFAPYVTTRTTEGGAIDVGPNCWFGASVTVLKGVRIGFGSIIGAGSIVTRDVPPWSTAVGNPARVLRRFHAGKNVWMPIDEWDAEAEALVPTESAYLEALRKSHPHVKLPRVASGHSYGDL